MPIQITGFSSHKTHPHSTPDAGSGVDSDADDDRSVVMGHQNLRGVGLI